MRKLDATLISGNNREDAILKIKDDSFAITTNEQIIKIPYSNIKDYSFDEKFEILSIIRFGGNPIEIKIGKDKQLLELLNILTIQNNNNFMTNYENKNTNQIELEENPTIKNTNNLKTEMELNNNQNKKKKSSSSIGLIVVALIVGIVFFGAKNLFFNKSSDDNERIKDISKFDINNTCWTSSNSKSNEIFCFDNKNVFLVKKIGNEFRATKYEEDMYNLIKISNTKGKFYNSSSTKEYEIRKDENNIVMDIDFGELVGKETYNLSNISTNSLNFTEPKINLNILGNDFVLNYPNLSPMFIFSKLTSNTLTIKDKDGNITNSQGYKFKAYGNKLIFMKENEYQYALKNGASIVLDEHTLCYKINNGTKQTNFMQMKETEEYSIENVVIHYCDNMD